MHKIDELDKNISILLVDDYSSVRKIVKNCLASLGFKNVTEAENGSAALDRIAENKFDLVISDWHMPDMFAGDLMGRMNVSAAHVPCIMLITEEQKKDALKKEAPERSDFMIKPFTAETLGEKLKKLFYEKGDRISPTQSL